MLKNLISYIILLILLTSIFGLKCGENNIDKCTNCNTDILGTCDKCENKYFLLVNKIACMKCDDEIYGNIGCGSICDGSNYKETRNVICEENGCKEGFYDIEGICYRCNTESPHCAKCSYLAPKGSTQRKFKCLQCDSDEYQLLPISSKCEKCEIPHCLESSFDKNEKCVCLKCENDYYVDEYQLCSKCYWRSIIGGTIYYCGEDIPPSKCTTSGYVSDNDKSCLICPKVCDNCYYNNVTEKANCKSCPSKYYLNKENTCTICPSICKTCSLNNKKEVICNSCYKGYFLNGETCTICIPHCDSCESIICSECSTGYTLYNGECLKCPDNCSNCKKDSNGNIVCLSCNSYYTVNTEGQCSLALRDAHTAKKIIMEILYV